MCVFGEGAEVWIGECVCVCGMIMNIKSVVSLMSSLRVISLTILADSIYNFLKFFAEKM